MTFNRPDTTVYAANDKLPSHAALELVTSSIPIQLYSFHVRRSLGPDCLNLHLTWVSEIEQHRHNQHWYTVEDIECPFVRKGKSMLALDILNDTEYRSNQNQNADCVQHIQCLSPRCFGVKGFSSGILIHANLEGDGCEEEEAKRDDLDEEADSNDDLANFLRSGLEYQSGSISLHQERKNIPNDKSFCDPGNSDN
jgi:hypothetical protein